MKKEKALAVSIYILAGIIFLIILFVFVSLFILGPRKQAKQQEEYQKLVQQGEANKEIAIVYYQKQFQQYYPDAYSENALDFDSAYCASLFLPNEVIGDNVIDYQVTIKNGGIENDWSTQRSLIVKATIEAQNEQIIEADQDIAARTIEYIIKPVAPSFSKDLAMTAVKRGKYKGNGVIIENLHLDFPSKLGVDLTFEFYTYRD
ncbi:hypothetical protein [Eubacterium sp.]|uniref:hypothetical protein n=1 Tax=Eubacterium sp. TaxID=142586 RepID=UPI0026E0F85B|nr:hypothetical protein [Eubacterium sp.]MDO5434474.1 hypothetical protein [Eubacterium sp.]